MAERGIIVFIFVFVCVRVCVCVRVSMCLCFYLCLCLGVCESVCPSPYVYLICLLMHLFIAPCRAMFVCLLGSLHDKIR